jgi:hypothetical protein
VLDSVIISDFPMIFDEFHGKRFSLLWRGGREGFPARDFHRRCNGHTNTLTVILDTDSNILGRFTQVEWESRIEWLWSKADPSLMRFLFTLKNPHNVPARRFALKTKMKDEPIFRDSNSRPHCGDIGVSDNCNTNTNTDTCDFGTRYINHKGLDRWTFPRVRRISE